MIKLLIVGAGGFLGSIARYLMARSIDARLQIFFPYGTLTVNILGSFILGVVWAFTVRRADSENIRLFLGTGICGGFTTFSAFTMENVNFMQQKMIGTSLLYISLSLVAGIFAVAAGMWFGKSL
ncbi:MAG: fluoride efflux transporter CrcB [Bacteroidota bacterium]